MFDSPYDPKKHEEKIYKLWENSGYFNPDNLIGKKTFIIYMPLPNITGTLHMGHALDNTLPDILIRYYRMKGIKTLWLPGTDHAGIATQYVVEKELKKKGISRFELGREKFIEKVWEWKKEYGNLILEQLKKLGISADWSRVRFTMDEAYARDVKRAFIHYYKKGWLYRGLRTVNWCPRCGTSLSELELEYKDEETKLWHIKYPGRNGDVTVVTTRPETMLGDTAVAVNPRDARYKKLIGKTVTLPIMNREIPIIEDEIIDQSFGTGAVKVTPAHDIADFEISERHKLPIIQVIDERGKMTKDAGKYEGLKAIEARTKIVEELTRLGLLLKTEKYSHRVTVCYRCNSTIEPIPSKQWFLKMSELAKMALEAVKSGTVKIHPENFKKPYYAWLENIRDWTVSRQIWWGHQLPVWFCKNDPEKFEVSEEKSKKCLFCNKCEMEQSPDILDTWFSSALWPFAGFREKDLKNYYPGDLVMNAREILNLWDARMIFSGLEFKGEVPFKNVLIHGTILTKDGKRMSKSLGTGIDPLKYIDQYGADATRFAVIWQANGQDIRWDETAVLAGRKFTNKIWNAARFVIEKTKNVKIKNNAPKAKTEADKKILESLSNIKNSVEKDIEDLEFNKALHNFYDFFWHEFCDVYLEISKKQFESENKESTVQILNRILSESLKLLHPFMPFITEQIYQTLEVKNKKLLLIEPW
ncbi:MAG: valine--tRNA ligase [Patescibacteria group bacterium]|nr:valine--tRNA ligase [Patescibacteria group bacterium]